MVTTKKPVEHAVVDLGAAVARHRYCVLHAHDRQANMKKKGMDLPNTCRILEICNPPQTRAILEQDMSLNLILPCRVLVYEDKGGTRIGMLRPAALLAGLSVDVKVAAAAREVEETMIRIIEEARQ